MHQTAMTKAVAGRESLRHDRTYTPHTKGKEAMSAYTLDYTYTSPSALIDGADSRALSLATSGGSTPEGAASHPYFFSGFLERADVYATALLVVARVARTRFFARLIPHLDTGGNSLGKLLGSFGQVLATLDSATRAQLVDEPLRALAAVPARKTEEALAAREAALALLGES